ADLAIDFCEDVPRLPFAAVDRIVALMRAAGMTAKISSIHVNGWFGNYDKLGMTRTLMQERYGVDLAREQAHYLFVGDSPNDAPMFRFFTNSVGVANVADFGERLADAPAYVAIGRSGAGFVEVAELLLAAGG
ncbi:MAG: HAD family hydrolase, partial [Burkholderiales bacterium]